MHQGEVTIVDSVCGTFGVLAAVFRVVLAVIFLVSATLKTRSPSTAANALHALGAPLSVAHLCVFAVAAVEMCLAFMLLAGIPESTALSVGFLLMALVAVVLLKRRHYDGGCGCFGAEHGHSVDWLEIARACVLLALAVLPVSAVYLKGCSLAPVSRLSPAHLGTALVVVLGLTMSYVLLSVAMRIRGEQYS